MTTTHKASALTRLTPADRDQLLAWLEQFPYTEIARRAALPRDQGGLELQTSPAALCRFYTRHARSADAYDLAHQLSQILAGRHAESPHTFFLASLGLLEKHAFLILNDDSEDADPLRAARLLALSLKLRRFQLEYLRHVPDLTRDQYADQYPDRSSPLTPEDHAAETETAARNSNPNQPAPHPFTRLAAEALLATVRANAPFRSTPPAQPCHSTNSTSATNATPPPSVTPPPVEAAETTASALTPPDDSPSTPRNPSEYPRDSADSTNSTIPDSTSQTPSTHQMPKAAKNPKHYQPQNRPFYVGALKRR